MMKLKYDEIFETGEESLKSMSYKLDEYLSERSDSRKGLTLRARVSGESADQFNALLKEFVAVDPNQHIHHEDTFHVTILSIVTARPGYVLPEDQVGEYVDVIQQAIRYINPFVISFDGVTASPSCIMVQGFVKDNDSTDGGARKPSKMSSIPEPSNALQDLRHSLRSCFSASDLESTMDQRYTITTAHSTVIRFRGHWSLPACHDTRKVV